MLDIAHANVLITGGASGIGRGLAERLLRAGAKVLVTGRDQEKLAALARARRKSISCWPGRCT